MEKLIVANLKMNLTFKDMEEYKLVFEDKQYSNLIICPSYIYLNYMKNNNYKLGSQDGYYENKGAFTGEVSFYQLKDIVNYSIVGHSERRTKFNETNDIASKKVDSCLLNNITPIICIGETKEEKDSNSTFNVIYEQLKSLNIMNKDVVIAYEPVYSIGTGIVPTIDEINEVHTYIKKTIKELFNIEPKIIYGGSVNLNNYETILNIPTVDGVLIGGMSNDPQNILKILNCK